MRLHLTTPHTPRVVRMSYSPQISTTCLQLYRQAAEDDVLHLNEPILGSDGQLTDAIFIPKGTKVTVLDDYLNVSEVMWGLDALTFNLDRWLSSGVLSDSTADARARTWSFGEGPRVCVGKAFALTQMKVHIYYGQTFVMQSTAALF